MKSKTVSIIISTLNRHKVLIQTLKLLLQNISSFMEVVIVDQSKYVPKDFLNFICEHKKIKYIRQNITSVPEGYNLGAKKARGEIVLYLDDDVIPSYRLVDFHRKNYSNERIGGVTGRVVEPYNNNVWTTGRVNYITKTGDVIQNLTIKEKSETNGVSGGNMSFRKSLIGKAGYFDPSFIGNAFRVETDFSIRVRELGYKIIFEPEAATFHLSAKEGGTRKTRENAPRWYYEYFRNYTYFFFKHGNHLYFPLFLIQKKIAVIWLKCIILGLIRWKKGFFIGFRIPLKGLYDGYKNYQKQYKEVI